MVHTYNLNTEWYRKIITYIPDGNGTNDSDVNLWLRRHLPTVSVDEALVVINVQTWKLRLVLT